MTIAGGSLWVTDPGGGTLSKLALGDGSPLGEPVELGGAPGAIAAGLGALWVADAEAGNGRQGRPGERRERRHGHRRQAAAGAFGRTDNGLGRGHRVRGRVADHALNAEEERLPAPPKRRRDRGRFSP